MELERFIAAQAPVYDQALTELKAGRKHSHWMWFVFPQIAGLSHSALAQRYAIASFQEADAYLAHPILGARLRECTKAVLALGGHDAHAVFGSPDDLKFRSSIRCSTWPNRTEYSSKRWRNILTAAAIL